MNYLKAWLLGKAEALLLGCSWVEVGQETRMKRSISLWKLLLKTVVGSPSSRSFYNDEMFYICSVKYSCQPHMWLAVNHLKCD